MKAIRGGSWQFGIRSFLDVELTDGVQVVHGRVESGPRDLLFIFLRIREQGSDEFYLFRWGDLQDYFHATYKGGRRTRNPDSFHCAVRSEELAQYRNNWGILGERQHEGEESTTPA